MKVGGKVTKTEILLVVLAAVFLAGVGMTYARETAVAPGADYTVSTQHSPDAPVTPAPEIPEAPAPVNINTAGEEELQTLTGIGPVLAERIVAYRAEHGPFQTVEELLEVKGIGEATLEKFRDSVTLGDTDEPVEEKNQ